MNGRRIFVTGTDTGVGKTRIATALCRAFAAANQRVAAMKPVATGSVRTRDGLRNADAMALMGAMNVSAPYADVNPYAFEPAIAPHIAAAEAGVRIEFDVLSRCYERLARGSEATIVEGAGGWLAPLGPTQTFADLAESWNLDVILVVSLRLGCLNHALLTAESIERRGVRLYGWVGNSVDAAMERRDENIAALRSRIAAPCMGTFGYAPAEDAGAVAAVLGPMLGLSERAMVP